VCVVCSSVRRNFRLGGWLKGREQRNATMGRYLLLWLLGVPIPILVLIWLIGGLH
jgi:bacteriorhodopsin